MKKIRLFLFFVKTFVNVKMAMCNVLDVGAFFIGKQKNYSCFKKTILCFKMTCNIFLIARKSKNIKSNAESEEMYYCRQKLECYVNQGDKCKQTQIDKR